MTTFGSRHLIINRNVTMIEGVFVTVWMLIVPLGRYFYSIFEMDSIHKH